jgi:hypothetical protein
MVGISYVFLGHHGIGILSPLALPSSEVLGPKHGDLIPWQLCLVCAEYTGYKPDITDVEAVMVAFPVSKTSFDRNKSQYAVGRVVLILSISHSEKKHR